MNGSTKDLHIFTDSCGFMMLLTWIDSIRKMQYKLNMPRFSLTELYMHGTHKMFIKETYNHNTMHSMILSYFI